MIIPPPIPKLTNDFFNKKFANRLLGDQRTLRIGNIISFVTPVDITIEDDNHKEINIVAPSVLNFCIEIPDISTYAGVCFQKFFITNATNVVANTKFKEEKFEIKNDDVIIHKEHSGGGIEQVSGVISINKIKSINNTIMIYFGLYNRVSAESHPRAYGLNIKEEDISPLMDKVNENFYYLANSIFLKTAKL